VLVVAMGDDDTKLDDDALVSVLRGIDGF